MNSYPSFIREINRKPAIQSPEESSIETSWRNKLTNCMAKVALRHNVTFALSSEQPPTLPQNLTGEVVVVYVKRSKPALTPEEAITIGDEVVEAWEAIGDQDPNVYLLTFIDTIHRYHEY